MPTYLIHLWFPETKYSLLTSAKVNYAVDVERESYIRSPKVAEYRRRRLSCHGEGKSRILGHQRCPTAETKYKLSTWENENIRPDHQRWTNNKNKRVFLEGNQESEAESDARAVIVEENRKS